MHDDDRTITLTTRLDKQLENKVLAVSHARKIHDVSNGKLLGVIVVSIDIKFIEIVNRNLQEGLRSRFMIIDEDEKIVYNVNEQLIGTLFRDNVRPSEAYNVVVTSPLSQQKWTTYVYMPLEELTADGKILGRNLANLGHRYVTLCRSHFCFPVSCDNKAYQKAAEQHSARRKGTVRACTGYPLSR